MEAQLAPLGEQVPEGKEVPWTQAEPKGSGLLELPLVALEARQPFMEVVAGAPEFPRGLEELEVRVYGEEVEEVEDHQLPVEQQVLLFLEELEVREGEETVCFPVEEEEVEPTQGWVEQVLQATSE
jgi:hypothetical protein